MAAEEVLKLPPLLSWLGCDIFYPENSFLTEARKGCFKS